jgi:lipopolysaccharide transport system permease protein
MMAWYKISPTRGVVLLPLFIVMATVTALGIGLWLTALNVKYRDVRILVPFITQVWMYASPVAYSITIVPENLKWLYAMNPMVGVIEGFRWALLGKAAPDIQTMLIPMAIVLAVLVGGFYYFKRMEKMFADII